MVSGLDHQSLLAKFEKPVPRYTSYPTAPHFAGEVGDAQYRTWLAELPKSEPVSLYIHIPYCDRMCWFCGCNTKQIKRYDPVPTYISTVIKEMSLLRTATGRRLPVHRVHLGGGSPSMLRAAELDALRDAITSDFDLKSNAEISIELDPSDLMGEEFENYKAFGITRASIGVQDFDPKVQAAINRPQTFEQTAAVVEQLRQIGINSINIDALYGLPLQTVDTVAESIRKVVELKPDRVALFGYAHVPWMKPNQRLIHEAELPDPLERWRQANAASDSLQESGYLPVGMDHFALPNDELAKAADEGRLHRNFQGYTDDPCCTILGVGASSIGRLPAGYVQNEPATGNYMRAIEHGQFAIARGHQLTSQDRLYADVIEDLMCHYSFHMTALRKAHGDLVDELMDRISSVLEEDTEKLTNFDGDIFWIRPQGRKFVRTVASWFDARMDEKTGRYSSAI